MASGAVTMRLADQRIEIGRLDVVLTELRLEGTVLVVGSERSIAVLDEQPTTVRLEFYGGSRSHNPHDVVADAARTARKLEPSWVLGLGSASAIDLAKAVAEAVGAPIIAAPTTLGGSEMTRFYGSRGPDRTKGGGSGKRLLPRTVVYDDRLLATLDGPWLAASGLNALAHAVEAHYARREHWPGRAAAAACGPELPTRLIEAAAVRTPELHRELFRLACLAGFASNSNGMGLHHAICHALGGRTGLPHALLNSVVLPVAVATNLSLAPDRVRPTLDAFGLTSGTVLSDIQRTHGLDGSLTALGVTAADAEAAVPLVMQSHHLENNPARVTQADVTACLKHALEGLGE